MALEYDLPKWNEESRNLLRKNTADRLKKLRDASIRAFDLLDRLNSVEGAPIVGSRLVTDAEPAGLGVLVRVKWRLCEEELGIVEMGKVKQVAKAIELLRACHQDENCYVVESSVLANQVYKNPYKAKESAFGILDADIRVL